VCCFRNYGYVLLVVHDVVGVFGVALVLLKAPAGRVSGGAVSEMSVYVKRVYL
jgi:hypothetical protein